jgi:hypothetical protein
MDRAMLMRHLALAERHITEGREHVVRQHDIIARLEAAGLGSSQTADIARLLLSSMQDSLAQHISDRDRLRDWLG